MKPQSYDNFWEGIHRAAKNKGFPLRVMFELTYRCNFFCRHCYVPLSYREKSKEGELRTEEIFLILDQLKDMVPEVSELVDIVKNEALAQFEETTLTEESEGEELEEPESPEQLKIRRNLQSIAAEASRRGLIDKDKESIDLYVQRLSFLSKEDLGVAKAFVFATVLPSLTREEILAEKAKLIEGKLAKTDVKREEAIDFIETEVELLNVTAKVELSKEAESVMKLKTNMRKGRGTLSEASEINVLAEKLKDVVKTSATLPGDKPLGSFSRGG